eukprot:13154064-Alexandrium_andersonii.AAC.1
MSRSWARPPGSRSILGCAPNVKESAAPGGAPRAGPSGPLVANRYLLPGVCLLPVYEALRL